MLGIFCFKCIVRLIDKKVLFYVELIMCILCIYWWLILCDCVDCDIFKVIVFVLVYIWLFIIIKVKYS